MSKNAIQKFVPKSKRRLEGLEQLAWERGSTEGAALEDRRREWGGIAVTIQQAANQYQRILDESKSLTPDQRNTIEGAKLTLLYQLATLEAIMGIFDASTVRVEVKNRRTGKIRDVRVSMAQCLYDILLSAEAAEEEEPPEPQRQAVPGKS